MDQRGYENTMMKIRIDGGRLVYESGGRGSEIERQGGEYLEHQVAILSDTGRGSTRD